MNYDNIKRILIIGNGGSGKSYLANRLGKLLHIPIIHLDHYYWKDSNKKITLNQWKTIHTELIAQPSWIIEGTQMRLLKERIQSTDFIIFLDICLFVNIFRVLKKYLMKITQDGFPVNKNIIKTLVWLIKFNVVYKKKLKNNLVHSKKRYITLGNKREINYFVNSLTKLANK